MTFFEEIKRNATGVADKAIRKTNEISSYARLTVNIKTCEVRLSGAYEEIGRLFYNSERNGEDHTSDIAAVIMKADAIKAEMASMQKELDKFRKIKTCPECGNDININATFCSFCGFKQEEPEADVEHEEEVKETHDDGIEVEYKNDDEE